MRHFIKRFKCTDSLNCRRPQSRAHDMKAEHEIGKE